MLDYDDNAFCYFGLTFLSLFVVPSLYNALSELYAAFAPGSDEVARTNVETQKAVGLKKKSKGLARLNNWRFILNLVLLALALMSMAFLLTQVTVDGKVNQFDPFAILKVESGASTKEIQKAYRKLSLQYHPDKNQGDKVAEEMFLKVARAYESLTDENAKKNLEEFGNPDGKQALEVSIGLPRALIDNPKLVLVLYLLAMVVVIPVCVGLWYAQSKQYGEKNIKYETYTAFYQLISENHRIKMLPEVFAASAEYRTLSVLRPTDREGINKLLGRMKNEKLMQKPKFEHPIILKGNLLLHAHVLRMTETLNADLLGDLDAMLSITPELIDALIEITHQRRWLQTTLSVMRFSQCILQGLWHSDNSLMQLPHFTDADIKHITKGGKVQARNLSEYIRVPDEEKKGLARFSAEEKDDILKVCSIIPRIKIETRLFVEEDDEEDENEAKVGDSEDNDKNSDSAELKGDTICENDMVTLRVTITRENLEEGEVAPMVYAPRFPRSVREQCWLVLSDRPKADSRRPGGEAPVPQIHAMEKISNQNRVIVQDLKFQAPPIVGSFIMDLNFCSGSYLGIDEEIEIKFDVHSASLIPVYKPHPEDLELDEEPTLFEQMLTGNKDDSSDDEADDELDGAEGNAAYESSSESGEEN